MINLKLSRSTGGISNTTLTAWNPTHPCLANDLMPTIGKKDGSYFLRCAGTVRDNATVSQTAVVLILDGDSRISEDGEALSGAPDPELVHISLEALGVNHVITSSYSNAATREELELKAPNINTGGLYGDDYHRYRVIIPIEYTRDQLPTLLSHFHELLFEDAIKLNNVKENGTWAQAWYFTRVPDTHRLANFKSFQYLGGGEMDATAICYEYLAEHPQPTTPEPKPNLCGGKVYAGLQVSPIVLFNSHFNNDPFAYLQTQGYRYKFHRREPRLLHPNSQSGDHGVQYSFNCKDGVTRVFSHNGSDPLCDKLSHDVFDCFRILEHGGDNDAALKAAGEMFFINGLTLSKHNARMWHEQNRQASNVTVDYSGLGVAL